MMRNLLLPLLLLSASFAGCFIEPDSAFSQALPIIAAAIMLSIAVSALAYLGGSFMKDPKLLVFSKDQLFQTFVSILLVLSIETIFVGTCEIATSASGGTDMSQASLRYLRALRVEGGSMLVSIMKNSIEKKFEAVNFIGYYAPYIGGETFWYSAYNNAYSRNLDILFDMVMAGYVSAGIQYYAFNVAEQIAIAILVPMGLILRTIPKAREAGNILLAIALAIYVVIPFTYAVHSSMQTTDVPWFTGEIDESGVSFEAAGKYLFQTIFLPNLVLVIFATAVGGLIKVAKVIP